jgi:hypothetical protein
VTLTGTIGLALAAGLLGGCATAPPPAGAGSQCRSFEECDRVYQRERSERLLYDVDLPGRR